MVTIGYKKRRWCNDRNTKIQEGGQVVQASESDRLLTNVRRGDEVRTSGGEQACTQCQRVAHTHEEGDEMTSKEISIYEVARLALANGHWREMISEILDLSDAEMDKVQAFAEKRLGIGEER